MNRDADVVQATAWYPPGEIGGTEVYVEALVDELRRLGIGSAVLVPASLGVAGRYSHGGAIVESYPVNEVAAPDELRRGAPHANFEVFRRRLAAHPRAIYHQHSWTRGCGLPHLLAARAAGLRTVVTLHVASALCLTGTMRRLGSAGCAGPVDGATCGACWAHSKGLPKPIAHAVASLPPRIGRLARRSEGRVATALAARALGCEKRLQIRRMVEAADRIVAVCAWMHEALVAGGAPREKLHLNRQGLPQAVLAKITRTRAAPQPGDGVLRLLFLGSFDPLKGLRHVVAAFASLPAALPVRLTVHAKPSMANDRHDCTVQQLGARDGRIHVAGPIAREDLAATLAAHDVLVVPSVTQETGPLVVLEAQAAGLFVLGSELGGIAELVRGDTSAELVEPGWTVKWADAISRLAERHAAEGGLPRRRRPVRTMATVAAEMATLYRSL